MSFRRSFLIVHSLILVAVGTGCPGPDKSTSPETPEVPNNPIVSLHNQVLLFVIPSSSGSSQFLPGINVTLETTYEYLFRYAPALNKLDQLERNSSPSYAPSSKTWYSSDDRVFVAREARAYEVGGTTNITEYTFDTFQALRSVMLLPPMSHSAGCAAAVGDTYFFRRNRNYDYFYGDVGGEFYKTTLAASSTPQILIQYGNPANCFGNLISEDGVLYDVLTNPKDRPQTFALYRRNLSTGLPESPPLLPLSESDPSLYASLSYRFAVDDGFFYIARRRAATGAVEIWKQSLTPTSGMQPSKVFDEAVGFDPYWFEVDDGQVMLAATNGKVLLWNSITGQRRPVTFESSITMITQVFPRR